jgi:hypothetical protein
MTKIATIFWWLLKSSMETKVQLFEPRVFKLLMRIKEGIFPGTDQYGMTNRDLAIEIINLIVKTSDDLGTPIYRDKKNFFICSGNEKLSIDKRGIKQFLVWVCRHLGLPKEIAVDPEFVELLFTKAWRYFSEDAH